MLKYRGVENLQATIIYFFDPLREVFSVVSLWEGGGGNHFETTLPSMEHFPRLKLQYKYVLKIHLEPGT